MADLKGFAFTLFLFVLFSTELPGQLLQVAPQPAITDEAPAPRPAIPASSAFVSIHDSRAPASAISQFRDGVEHTKKQQWKEAEEHFRKAVNQYREFDAAKAALGRMLVARNAWDEAETLTTAALEDSPNYPALLQLMGLIYQHNSRFDDSIPLLQRSLSLDPKNEHAMALLAVAELERGDCEKAASYGLGAHRLKTHHHASVHLTRAVCLERLGRPAEAIDDYQIYLREATDHTVDDKVQQRIDALSRAKQP